MTRVPGWFKAVFAAGMLAACAVLCWFAPSQYTLRFQRDDLTLSLETSRQREAKQRYEYAQVEAALPETARLLEETQPLAAKAAEAEAALRARRKALREENARLEEQLSAAQAALEEAEAQRASLQQEADELSSRQQELALVLEALQAVR